jgi:ketosteroid isomerase-like protein
MLTGAGKMGFKDMAMANDVGPLGAFIHDFYDARRDARDRGEPDALAAYIAEEVRWIEPEVGAHMGVLEGRDAVLDMIRRAQETTGGTFDLSVTSTVETLSHVAAVIDWSADKDARPIHGQELAVFEIRDGCITSAWFHAANLADDEAFWNKG